MTPCWYKRFIEEHHADGSARLRAEVVTHPGHVHRVMVVVPSGYDNAKCLAAARDCLWHEAEKVVNGALSCSCPSAQYPHAIPR